MNYFEIKWTPFASWCLDEIKDYLFEESKSEEIANKQIQRILKRAEQLKLYPESGPKEPLLKQFNQNSRYLIEGNYKLIYQLTHKIAIITDVFHVKQSPKKMARRNKKR